jgi:hypothetical protein
MPPAKKAAPAARKAAVPAKAVPTITLKHLAAALSDSHDPLVAPNPARFKHIVSLMVATVAPSAGRCRGLGRPREDRPSDIALAVLFRWVHVLFHRWQQAVHEGASGRELRVLPPKRCKGARHVRLLLQNAR